MSASLDETLAVAIAALLAGEGTPNERRHWEQVVENADEGPEWLALFQATANVSAARVETGDREAFRRRVHARITNAVSVPVQSPERLRTHVIRQSRWREIGVVRGAVAALMLCGAMYGMTTLISRGIVHGDRVVRERIYATARSEQAHIELPDGSRAMLAPETKLTYTVTHAGERVVTLRGQAYFTVVHGATQPFTVHTRHAITRVLGTAFDVRQYDTDAAAQVAVTMGRVTVGSAMTPQARQKAPVVLTPGMTVLVGDSATTSIATRDPVTLVSWTQGRLTFDDAPVPVVLETIGRWYGYQFQLADSALAHQRVTIGLPSRQPVEGMTILKDVLDVTMRFNGKTVIVSAQRNGRSSRPPPIRAARTTSSLSMESGK
jgi:transmembrane sensor